MEKSEKLIADLDEDLKLLEEELDDISERGVTVDVTIDPLIQNEKDISFVKADLQNDKISVHGNINHSTNIEVVSEVCQQTDGIILPNDKFSQSEIAFVTVSNQTKNPILIESDVDEVLDPLKGSVSVERDESLGIINNSKISVGSHFSSIADNSSDILVKGIGSFYNKIEDDNSVILLDANICDEINISKLNQSFSTDDQIVDVVNEALDEFEKSFSFDREKITVESFTKTYSSYSDDLSIRHFNNVTIVNFINVEGDIYENNINLISK